MSIEIEEWRPIQGYEGLYEVSDWGRVKSLDRTFEYLNRGRMIKRAFKGQVLKKVLNKDGYHIVSLFDYNHKLHQGKVHRLVAEAFLPNHEDEKNIIDHINGNKIDNRAENLHWVDAKENANNPNTILNMRGIQNGRQVNRKDCSKVVFQYDLNWNFIKEYPSASEASRQNNCHQGTIAKAAKGHNNNKVLNYYWKYGN